MEFNLAQNNDLQYCMETNCGLKEIQNNFNVFFTLWRKPGEYWDILGFDSKYTGIYWDLTQNILGYTGMSTHWRCGHPAILTISGGCIRISCLFSAFMDSFPKNWWQNLEIGNFQLFKLLKKVVTTYALCLSSWNEQWIKKNLAIA